MRLRNLAMLAVLALCWGPSFLFIKVAVAEIPPFTLILGRVGIAAAVLLALLHLQGGRLPRPGRVWLHLAVVALIYNSLPWILLSWGEQRIDSALASIVNGTTPIFTILLAHFLTRDDRITPAKGIGIALGIGGTLLLVGNSLAGGVETSGLGLAAVILVSALYGLALVYSRQKLRGLPPLVAPTSQLLLATLYLLPPALLLDRPWQLPAPSAAAAGSMVGLALLGTALAFAVYYRLVERTGATYVSMVTYLAPIVGVLLGVLVLGERLTWNMAAGFALILLGVMVANGLLRRLGRPAALGCWTFRLRALVGRPAAAGDASLPC